MARGPRTEVAADASRANQNCRPRRLNSGSRNTARSEALRRRRRGALTVAVLSVAAVFVLAIAILSPDEEPEGAIVAGPSETPSAAPTTTAPAPIASPTPATAVRTVSVREFGASGDGTTDDTEAVLAALTATAGQRTAILFPAGTYRVTDVQLPWNVILKGEGADRSWIQGRLEVGGGSRVADLRLGRDGAALRFAPDASQVLFRRVAFTGGGGMTSGEDQGVIRFSGGRSASFIAFEDCKIGANSVDGNGVSMVSNGSNDATYHDITWRRCRFGSSPRMGLEVIQRADHAPITSGYRRIDLYDCVFEPTGSETVSFDAVGDAGYSTISGCTFKGSGWNSAEPFGQGIEFNSVTDMRFVHNTVYRGRDAMINHQGRSGSRTGTVFAHNVFDARRSFIEEVPSASTQVIYFSNVSGVSFRDNVVKSDVGGQLAYIDGSADNTFLRNKWTDTRAVGLGHACLWLTDGSQGNVFDTEIIKTGVAGPAIHVRDGSDENVFRDCTFILPGQSSPSAESAFHVASGLTLRVLGGSYTR